MSITMHASSVPVFTKLLGNLSAILDKAAADAEARKIDPAVFLASRLAPDMFPLSRQIQIAADFAKGTCARLAGVEVPKYEDSEVTLAEFKARIEKTLAFISGLQADAINGSEEREIKLTSGGKERVFKGQTYLLHYSLPHFYFHLTTAYAILRHNGVGLGKGDFVGAVQ
jgi:hypothetical protein